MIAAVSAVLLLLIMFIFKWFGNDFGGANAWESFSFIDIVLFVTILVAIGAAVMKANAQSVNTPVALSAITAGLGILSVLLILFRIIDPPDFGSGDAIDAARSQAEALGVDSSSIPDVDIGRKIGVFLGLIAAAGIAYGGFLGMREEGTSFSEQGDRLQNRGGTGTSAATAPHTDPTAPRNDPPPPRNDPPPPAV